MNLKRGFLRAWVAVTALWLFAASAFVYTVSRDTEAPLYLYDQQTRGFERIYRSSSKTKALQERVRRGGAIEIEQPDGVKIFADMVSKIEIEGFGLVHVERRFLSLPVEDRSKVVKDIISAIERPEKRRDPKPGEKYQGPIVDNSGYWKNVGGTWKRVTWSVPPEDSEFVKRRAVADFDAFQKRKRWKRAKNAAFMFAVVGLLPPVSLFFVGVLVGWVARGFRNV